MRLNARVFSAAIYGLCVACSGVAVSAATTSSPSAVVEAVAEINRLLISEMKAAVSEKAPAPACDDETFLRRASFDLIGSPPTAQEITAFSLDPAVDKRLKAVDRLLADKRFGENWSAYWRDVILMRRSEQRALIVAPALTRYLTDSFNNNTPWDEIVRSFITATGDVREVGATAIFIAQGGETVDIAAETARIFTGVQIACAQCHDHKTDRWKRTQFHELAAFFPRIAVQQVNDGERRSFAIVSVDNARRSRANNNEARRGRLEHYMPDLDDPSARGTLMQPEFFISGQKLSTGAEDQERRTTLAKWLTAPNNEWFAKAYVNRLWSELVGEGFYEPVDDIGPDRDCFAPKTVDYLAAQFVAQRYDTKWLLKTIMSTTAYQRQSRERRNPAEAPFLASCPQRLRADQLYTALVKALGGDPFENARANRVPQGPAQLRTPRAQFDAVFGYDPSEPRAEVESSIPQALLLMNSPQLNRAIDGDSPRTNLGKLLSENKNDEQLVVELYLRSLAREPKPIELKTCLAHVKKTGNRADGFEDILWALVNSTEFLHRK